MTTPHLPLPSTKELADAIAKELVSKERLQKFWSDLSADLASQLASKIDERDLEHAIAQAATEKRIYKPGEA